MRAPIDLCETLPAHMDGVQTFRALLNGIGHWDGQGNGGFKEEDGLVAQWRADGSWRLIQHEDRKWLGRADGAFEMRSAEFGRVNGDAAGNGSWVLVSAAKGVWRADGSGMIQHADGAVESWTNSGGITFITPDGREMAQEAFQAGEFLVADGTVAIFFPDGSCLHRDAHGDIMRYLPNNAGVWEGEDGRVLTWHPEMALSLSTPDGQRLVLEGSNRLYWEESTESSWLDGDGKGGWIRSDGAWGVWEADGAFFQRDPQGGLLWRDATGLIGWQTPDGLRGGQDASGGRWQIEVNGAFSFVEGEYWYCPEEEPDSTDPDGQERTLMQESGFCEVWEPGIFTLQDPDKSIGVWHADGSGSWSNAGGDLDIWDALGRHRIALADGSSLTIDRDEGFVMQGLEGSWQLKWDEIDAERIDPRAVMAGEEGMLRRLTALRISLSVTTRMERLDGRMGTLRARLMRTGKSRVHGLSEMVASGDTHGEVRMQRIRVLRRWLDILARLRRIEHQIRRPRRRVDGE
ncbi:MAG: hypothetical protein H7834_06365 [Magnetococcus sp. YQC-9]